MDNCPAEVNGWNFTGDVENMIYWKDFGDRTEAVALVWLDVCEEDEGYRPDGDCWALIWAQNVGDEIAIESLYYSNMTFGDIAPKVEAIKQLIDYMERH